MIKKLKQNLKKHRLCGKLVQTQTIIIPKNSNINRIFCDDVINQNQKYEYHTIEVIFENESDTIEFYYGNTPNKDIEFYIKHLNFSHIFEMIIRTISDIRNMTYEFYIKQPKNMVEFKFNMNIAKNPHLINTLDGRINHPLVRKYSHIPCIN